MRHRIVRIVAAVTALTFLGSVSAMALTLARTRTFPGQQLSNGDNPLPVAGINIPNRTSFAEVRLTRDNWPAEGVDLSIELTWDAGQTWIGCAPPNHISQGTFDPKIGGIAPAKIGCGWNPDRKAKPDSGRLRVGNAGAAFLSDIEVDFYTDQ